MNQSASYAGWLFTVYQLAYGWWKFQATKETLDYQAAGKVEAFDIEEAKKLVKSLIDTGNLKKEKIS